ncbi:MAG: DUF2283 domain-containing protein [Aquificae bacterium]|nr:DUF2283 domain-containing protein [Aquificota bacterium]
MQVSYEPETDILFIKLKDKPPVESEHLDNDVIVDYDEEGEVVAIEILDFKKRAEKGFSLYLTKA